MKLTITTLLFILSSCGFHKAVVEVYNPYSRLKDTISIKAKGGLCIATFEGDTIPKLIDKRPYILADSVNDFKVLYYKKKK